MMGNYENALRYHNKLYTTVAFIPRGGTNDHLCKCTMYHVSVVCKWSDSFSKERIPTRLKGTSKIPTKLELLPQKSGLGKLSSLFPHPRSHVQEEKIPAML